MCHSFLLEVEGSRRHSHPSRGGRETDPQAVIDPLTLFSSRTRSLLLCESVSPLLLSPSFKKKEEKEVTTVTENIVVFNNADFTTAWATVFLWY